MKYLDKIISCVTLAAVIVFGAVAMVKLSSIDSRLKKLENGDLEAVSQIDSGGANEFTPTSSNTPADPVITEEASDHKPLPESQPKSQSAGSPPSINIPIPGASAGVPPNEATSESRSSKSSSKSRGNTKDIRKPAKKQEAAPAAQTQKPAAKPATQTQKPATNPDPAPAPKKSSTNKSGLK